MNYELVIQAGTA